MAHSASGLRLLALSEGTQLIGALRAFERRVALSNVRFRGANGKHMLTVSSSDFDVVDGARSRHRCAIGCVGSKSHEGAVQMQISTIGLDIAKNVFQVHGIDANETVVVGSDSGVARCWRSSKRCRRASSAWRPT